MIFFYSNKSPESFYAIGAFGCKITLHRRFRFFNDFMMRGYFVGNCFAGLGTVFHCVLCKCGTAENNC